MEKISIIIPLYNSEDYILACLKSISEQAYINTEIIVIDDYSSDNSVDIVKKYTKKDPRVKLIQCKENVGQAVRRLDAVETAIGEYVAFVDSDDFIAPNLLSTAYRVIKEHDADLVAFKLYNIKSETKATYRKYRAKLQQWSTSYTVRGILLDAEIFENQLQINTKNPNPELADFSINNHYPLKLFKRSLFNGLEKPEYKRATWREDLLSARIIFFAKKCVAIENKLYFYRKNNKDSTESCLDLSAVDSAAYILNNLNTFLKNNDYIKRKSTLEHLNIYMLSNLLNRSQGFHEDPAVLLEYINTNIERFPYVEPSLNRLGVQLPLQSKDYQKIVDAISYVGN
jgi:glycosyltransferase involved in cell wall biosynthesis